MSLEYRVEAYFDDTPLDGVLVQNNLTFVGGLYLFESPFNCYLRLALDFKNPNIARVLLSLPSIKAHFCGTLENKDSNIESEDFENSVLYEGKISNIHPILFDESRFKFGAVKSLDFKVTFIENNPLYILSQAQIKFSKRYNTTH